MTAATVQPKVMLGRFYDAAAYSIARDSIGADWCPRLINNVAWIGTASRIDEAETFWQKLCRLIRRLFK